MRRHRNVSDDHCRQEQEGRTEHSCHWIHPLQSCKSGQLNRTHVSYGFSSTSVQTSTPPTGIQVVLTGFGVNVGFFFGFGLPDDISIIMQYAHTQYFGPHAEIHQYPASAAVLCQSMHEGTEITHSKFWLGIDWAGTPISQGFRQRISCIIFVMSSLRSAAAGGSPGVAYPPRTLFDTLIHDIDASHEACRLQRTNGVLSSFLMDLMRQQTDTSTSTLPVTPVSGTDKRTTAGAAPQAELLFVILFGQGMFSHVHSPPPA